VNTNPHALATIEAGNSIFTNVALTDHGATSGGKDSPKAHRTTSPTGGAQTGPRHRMMPAAHPNSRYCTPIAQCPTAAPEWDDPAGVPISAILFGGRRASTIPLITQSLNWQHGVFLASTLPPETTAAATGPVGVLRRDPMAMPPFLGYHVGDYFQHWLDIGTKTDIDLLPKILYVNWFHRDDDGTYLWPGFGENAHPEMGPPPRRGHRSCGPNADRRRTRPRRSGSRRNHSLTSRAHVAPALDVRPADGTAETALIDHCYTKIGGFSRPCVKSSPT
jgi:phosphoenolpyruvate carboxykinase (GTP)